MTSYPVTLEEIRQAARGLEGIARRTPLLKSDTFGARPGARCT